MLKFGVVILNYLAYECSINCVNSFLNQKRKCDLLRIVVVDNNSPNESYEILKQHFVNNEDVTVIKADSNRGFSCGNNYGYSALESFGPFDYYIFSNDDIIFEDGNLFDWIEETYSSQEFAILGPDIYSKRYLYHQSPLSNSPTNYIGCKKFIFKLQQKKMLAYIKDTIKNVIKYQAPNNVNNFRDSEGYREAALNVTLHGSFLVFHNSYFDNYTEPFDPRLFLYGEEDILRLRCLIKNLSLYYSPKFTVTHLQDSSSFTLKKTDYFKEYKRLKHQIDSLSVYCKLLRENGY